MAQKNPWDEDYQVTPVGPVKQAEPQKLNPWDEGYQGSPMNNTMAAPTQTEVLSGEDPLQNDLNRMREQGEFDTIQLEEPQTIRSYDELYGGVLNNPKYKQLQELEDQYPLEVNRTWMMPKELEPLKAERDAELRKIYERTGEETTVFGVPVRVQEKKLSNPNFDPNIDPSPENPVDITRKYLVDEPDREQIMNMGYQVLENIIGGIGDFVTEGKISGEGKVGEMFPDTVPNSGGEAFATEMATYILAGGAAQKVASKAAQVGKATLAARAAAALSPAAQQSIRDAYQTVLQATGSVGKATAAASRQSQRLAVGLSLGLVEGVVSPDDSEGLSGQMMGLDNVQKIFGVDKERAKDISLVLDGPIIGGTLTAMGKLYDTVKEKFVAPAVGGLRNASPFGINVGAVANKFTMSEKDAGLKVITWLDPELAAKSTPEEAVFRIKVLADALERNATKQMKLGTVGKELAMDTPAAFTEIAEDYYKMAYGNLRNRPDLTNGQPFDDWVKDRAARSANRLFELRTALKGDSNVNQRMAKTSSELNDLLNEGADAQAPMSGGLINAQGEAGQILAAEKRQGDQLINDRELQAKQKMDQSQEAVDNAIGKDSDIQSMIANADLDVLGSSSKLDRQFAEAVGEPLYRSFKKLKTDVDDAYGKVAQTGADGDPVSLLKIIRESGHTDDSGKITNPILKRIAENVQRDSSFDNIYNTIRKDVSEAIQSTADGNDPQGIRSTLLKISSNIRDDQLNFLRANGDDDVVAMIDDAKNKYINYRTAFDDSRLRGLANREGRNRLRGETLPKGVGVGQGRSDWDINSVRTIQSNLEGATGERFREELDRAVKAGGEDISQPLAEYYAAQSISNIADKVVSGNKQSVGTLRSALKGVIENLQRSGQTGLIDKFRNVEARIQTLQNVADVDKKVYDQVMIDVEDLRKQASDSVLKKFIANGEDIGQSGTAKTLKSIFRGAKGPAQVKELLKRADDLGERGVPIREAIQGTYLDSLRDRMFSNRDLGAAKIEDKAIESGFKANEAQIRKIFEPGSMDLENLNLIFKDQPEIIKELKEIGSTLNTATKTTPNATGDILGPVPLGQDPEKGMSTMTTLMFGVLNPTATRIRKFTGPMSITSLQQVRDARNAVLVAMITDPKGFSKMATTIANETESKIAQDWARGITARAGLRSWATTNDEMKRLK